MAIKQRLLKADKRLPPPPENGWPGLQVFLEESARIEEWLAATGLTSTEAHRRGMEVPGNTFVTLPFWLEMERRRPEWEAQQKVEQVRRDAEYEAQMAQCTQQGAAACTSSTDRPRT